jgi:hypothetical protein
MTDCKTCQKRGSRCYCPPDRNCTHYIPVNEPTTSHAFIFDTSIDWVPGEAACWVDCPFSFNIRLSDSCRCRKDPEHYKCPFKNSRFI